jgi:ABC-2 type transport system ATP-binding protein
MSNSYNHRPLALRLHNILVQRSGFRLSVEDISVPAGTMVCLLGPNGGGKTTILLTALGLLPHKGTCLVDGHRFDGGQKELLARIGYLPADTLPAADRPAHEQWLATAQALVQQRDNLYADLLAAEAKVLARSLGLLAPAELPLSHYSVGMRRKYQLAHAVMGQRSVLLLDEPAAGLDAASLPRLDALLQAEQQRGAGILVATNDITWAEQHADYIYVLNGGEVVAAGQPAELIQPSEENQLAAAYHRLVRTADTEDQLSYWA